MIETIEKIRFDIDSAFTPRHAVLWQELFNVYRNGGGSLESMDCMIGIVDDLKKIVHDARDSQQSFVFAFQTLNGFARLERHHHPSMRLVKWDGMHLFRVIVTGSEVEIAKV